MIACACGRSYTASEWARRKPLGIQDGITEHLLLTNCGCGSAKAVSVCLRLIRGMQRAERLIRSGFQGGF